MKKRLTTIITLVVLGLLIIPVVIRQMIPSDRRSFQYVRLSETRFQEIQFDNKEQGVKLAGLLFMPDQEGPFPAVVFIHGSGTSRRDSGWYLTLVQFLQKNGILVLLPDKRGSEQSQGNWRTASFADLATDTEAAISYLNTKMPDSIASIGIIGMSQGGHIAPLVAPENPEVAFVINVVGGAVPMHQQLYYEENNNLKEMGFLPGYSHLIAILSSYHIRKVGQKEFWDAVGNFNVLPYWEQMNRPALVLYGDNDTNVPSRKSARLLNELNNKNIQVKIYQDSGHALETPEGEGDLIFREDAMQDILQFIIDSTD